MVTEACSGSVEDPVVRALCKWYVWRATRGGGAGVVDGWEERWEESDRKRMGWKEGKMWLPTYLLTRILIRFVSPDLANSYIHIYVYIY